ncbi:hypothetical protein L596_009082 [Steinernema carpocapsae]|uniref:Uncharacterized protein n=1 Tax=Steinernema carpocapsae TaxID=34508 RepID=A0A4U5PEC0_STECR|nr:hypothetical protein L596_009082 [Steinernema carpocapsae]
MVMVTAMDMATVTLRPDTATATEASSALNTPEATATDPTAMESLSGDTDLDTDMATDTVATDSPPTEDMATDMDMEIDFKQLVSLLSLVI